MKKYLQVIGIILLLSLVLGCIKTEVNVINIEKSDLPLVLNRSLNNEEIKEIYINNHDFRIKTEKGYFYFNNPNPLVKWAFRDYNQRIRLVLQVSKMGLEGNLSNVSWNIKQDMFDGLPIENVKFATAESKELSYEEDIILDGVKCWSVGSFDLKGEDIEFFMYLNVANREGLRYKDLDFYKKVVDDNE